MSRTQFLKADVLRALSKSERVAECDIVLADGLPEVIGHTDNVQKPANTGRKRGSKNKMPGQIKMELLPPGLVPDPNHRD